MKRYLSAAVAIMACLCLDGCSAKSKTGVMVFALLSAITFILALVRTFLVIRYNRKRKKSRKPPKNQNLWTVILLSLSALFLLIMLVFTGCFDALFEKKQEEVPETEPEVTTVPVETEPPVVFVPQKTESSDPANWGITWEVFQGEEILTDYARPESIRFFEPENYFALPGIAAFRGNNYRNSATYGTATVSKETISAAWSVETGKLKGSRWTGSGWTGQPLIVKWDEATRKIMNLYPEKKENPDLVEVIYATLDGHIYFLDLYDGSYTRDPINMGMCFKGAGSLDPRGYPLMYVGAGDVNADGDRPRMYVISLIDGTVLFEYGNEETMAFRKDNDAWCAFDSSPLVHAKTDTLIWPGENGVLYTMKLNTQYDAAAGTISVSPDNIVCARYKTERSSKKAYWYGYEASINMVGNYLYVSENGGMFYCVDINTMELVWAQDTKDDSNSTPVFERTADDSGFLYTAPSLHWTKGEKGKGKISIYKLNAITGEIVWEKSYKVYTVDGVSGGVQATPLLGKPGTNLEGLIIYPVARTPKKDTGILVALDTQTGEEVWKMDMTKYAWSSPVAVYTSDGKGYIVAFDAAGRGYLLDGATGKELDSLTMGGFVEASPAVYENMLIVGTRNKTIQGLKIK